MKMIYLIHERPPFYLSVPSVKISGKNFLPDRAAIPAETAGPGSTPSRAKPRVPGLRQKPGFMHKHCRGASPRSGSL